MRWRYGGECYRLIAGRSGDSNAARIMNMKKNVDVLHKVGGEQPSSFHVLFTCQRSAKVDIIGVASLVVL